MTFEWDEDKAETNRGKHDVSFDEATSVFQDPLFLAFLDPEHSRQERRFIIMGESSQRRLLVVAYAERMGNTRIISARLATRKERKAYESEL